MLISRNVILILASLADLFIPIQSNGGWRSDLDWNELKAQLSHSASLIDVSFKNFSSECLPEFTKNFTERSNYNLIDKPSGLCVSQEFCAYERCYPRPNKDGHANTTNSQRIIDLENTLLESYADLTPKKQQWITDADNPSLDLPSKVLFPIVASDVVAAVSFAKKNGLEISVKNSGHSLKGASTKKDTLHLNMNRFTQYSPTGIVDCPVAVSEPMLRKLFKFIFNVNQKHFIDDQLCALANARGKPAYIRVGGGENWDKTYRAVAAVNKVQGNKYHVVGGAVGTVSPMGWTFEGGLGGTSGGRMYGFGVDQVLQVEMVLPNGHHVRFGPTEWKDASADGFTVPKTISVGGVCRANPEELDEDKWDWSTCPEDSNINFNDLWFAVCGGGGGTWGVVTSIYLQLHKYMPSGLLFYGPGSFYTCEAVADDEVKESLPYIFEAFRATFFLSPSNLNISQAVSNACGAPESVLIVVCYGDEGEYETMYSAWVSYLENNKELYGLGDTPVDDLLPCFFRTTLSFDEFSGRYLGRGHMAEIPPTLRSLADDDGLNILIPKEYFENNIDDFIENIIFTSILGSAYYAFGVGTSAASDQANSLSTAHRNAAVKINLPSETIISENFVNWFDLSDKDNFPSFLGANHVGIHMFGPLKNDWTQLCPKEWTLEEHEEKCISVQEGLYGTKTLSRLEAIKKTLDPDYMFDCNGCVGNNRDRYA